MASSVETKKKEEIRDEQLHYLKMQAPDVFPDDYKCGFRYLPCIIDRKDVLEWRSKTFKDKNGFEHKRQVMPFPPIPDPLTADPDDKRVKYWFSVPESAAQYCIYFPCLKINQFSNADLFPLLPSSHSIDTLSSKNTLYYSWLSNPSIKFKRAGWKFEEVDEKKEKLLKLPRKIRHLLDHRLRYRMPGKRYKRGRLLELAPLEDLKVILGVACKEGYIVDEKPILRVDYIAEITKARKENLLKGIVWP